MFLYYFLGEETVKINPKFEKSESLPLGHPVKEKFRSGKKFHKPPKISPEKFPFPYAEGILELTRNNITYTV